MQLKITVVLTILFQLLCAGNQSFFSAYAASKESSSRPPNGDFSKNPPKNLEVSTLAGGCFWGMEEIIRKIPGVVDTQVGYSGGSTSAPSYTEVSSGKTGHAESVQVLFEPKVLGYEKLLSFFFRLHDPTTLNQQGNDKGTQYRSVIFTYNKKQENIARQTIKRINKKGTWKKTIVTEIIPAGPFWPAEPEHQDYLQKNPNGYTCHYLRDE